MNFPVIVSFDDGINVRDGQFELNAILLAGLAVTSNPAKTVYRTGERISYSGLAVTAIYTDDSTADVTSICSINPPESTEIDSDITAEISYSEGQDEQSTSLQLTHLYLTRLNITHQPDKTMYKTGETISYAGLIVTASYSDGSARVVTDSCSISPAEGKAFDPDSDSQVEISYEDIESAEASFSLTHNSVRSIAVTSQPDKTWYRKGENIDYTGLIVTATYSDDSTDDVTDLCTITPSAGKPFDPDTDSYVEISFDDNSSAMIQLNELYLTGLSVTSNPDKTAYIKGEYIDYTGLVVTASYSDSSTEDVTASCDITPHEGKEFDPDTDTNADVTYSEGTITETAGFMLTEIYMTGLQVTSNPLKTAYKHDEVISYEGLVVTANYSNGTSEDVTSKCSITPAEGKTFDAETDTYAEITYSQGDNEANCMLTLTPILLTSLAVTTAPHKFAYLSGEPIDYTGIAVTASYSDSSEDDVTDKCVFSPAEGTLFSGDTNVTITYTEGQNEMTCSLTLGETSMTLIVASMPNKTSYQPGEALDIAGLVIKAVHLDGSQHNVTDFCDFSSEIDGSEFKVTAKCAITPSPYIFDHRGGYVDNGSWICNTSSPAYSDIYSVEAGHKYLLALDEHVGSRFKVMFTTADVSNASDNVSGTAIIDTSNPAICASVQFTPSSNGYIVVTKDSKGTAGVKTYLYDADCSVKNIITQFTLSTVAVTALAVTKPVKTRYRTGEKFDYTGAVVTATYSDGTVLNVTEHASFSPVNGSTAVSDNPATIVITQVIVSYGGLYAGFDVTMSGLAIMSLSVTPPNKISYRTGETLDYTGCKVIAVYWDGSEKDVTASAVFEPANGTSVSKYSLDETSNLPVSISYQEIDETLCSNVNVDNTSYDYNEVYDKYGQTMDYASTYSIKASVRYLDTETGQIRNTTINAGPFTEAPYIDSDSYISHEIYADLLANGQWYGWWDHEKNEFVKDTFATAITALTVREFYGFTQVNGQFGYIVRTFHDLYPDRVSRKMGDGSATVDWFAENCAGRYPLGESFVPLMTAYYDSHASCTLNLSVATLLPTLSITPPEKTVYHYREALEYNGYFAAASYSNGDSEDVTALVTFSPRAGSIVTSSRSVEVRYSNAGGDYAKSTFNITVLRLSRIAVTSPEKTSYRQGEAIDYTGVAVTAVYSDGSMVDVTSYAVFSPANGTVITEDMTGSVSVSYTNEWSENASGSLSLSIE